MILALYILFLIAIPISLFKRLNANAAGNVVNPLFYLVVFSYLYLLVPGLYIDYAIEASGIRSIDYNANLAQLLCLWYVAVFYLFYYASTDYKFEFTDNKPNKSTVYFAWIYSVVIFCLLLFVLVKDVPNVFIHRADRTLALTIYEETINARYKLHILLFIQICCVFLLFWNNKNLKYLLLILPFLIIDFSHGGRTVSLIVIIFSYILYVLKYRKTYLLRLTLIIVCLALLGIMQRSNFVNLQWTAYLAAVEFSNTRLTTNFVVNDTNLRGDLPIYILNSLYKIFPGGLFSRLIDFGDWYGENLSEQIGIGYGLAGNLPTEAVYYGGIIFGFISPIFIGGFFKILNMMKIYRYPLGFFYLLLICIKSQDIMRSFFYGQMLYPIQIELFFMWFIIVEYKKRIFKN